MSPPESQAPALAAYAALLRQWSPRINLVAPKTLEKLEQRHVADCAQLLNYLPAEPSRILDVGSGAGLPGVVLAILAPQHQVTLAESDQRKAAFLLTVKQQLGLANVTVWAGRVEALPLPHDYDILTARAFAPLARLLPQTAALVAPAGRWLLLKGEAIDAEIEACGTQFHEGGPLTICRHRSTLADEMEGAGWIVEITKRAADGFPHVARETPKL